MDTMDHDSDGHGIFVLSDSDDTNETTGSPTRDAERLPTRLKRTYHPSDPSTDQTEKRFLESLFSDRFKRRQPARSGRIELELRNFHIHALEEPKRVEPFHIAVLNPAKYAFCGITRLSGMDKETTKSIELTAVQIVDIGGIDKDNQLTNSCQDMIWIQTRLSAYHNCYYILQKPKKEYSNIFADFQWLSKFTSYVIDYLLLAERDQKVCLNDFRESFGQHLQNQYNEDRGHQHWHNRCGRIRDFRRYMTCATHAEFIYQQAEATKKSRNSELMSHTLWKQIAPQRLSNTISYQEISQKPTFVTDFVARCFLATFPDWEERQERKGKLVEIVKLDPRVSKLQKTRSVQIGLGKKSSYDQRLNFEKSDGVDISVAALLLEKASSQISRSWSAAEANNLVGKAVVVLEGLDYRFAYVQIVLDQGRRMRIRWLTLPSQTICNGRSAGKISGRPSTFYPAGRELFWSDNFQYDIKLTCRVVAVHKISVYQDYASPGDDLFVHRRYVARDSAITESTHEDMAASLLHELSHFTTARQGIRDRTAPPGRILSLFSGAGILDSGFEEGAEGIFETIFAADCDYAALSSFKANHPQAKRCKFRNEDVNKLFWEFCTGRRPLPDIDILIAGCPCQGFSRLNTRQDTDKARKNRSMLANTLAWIDLLRPRMVLIENVTDMDPTGPKGGVSPAGQAIACLVGMGYQARLATIRASDYGGPTIRKRLFIIATTPGIPLPQIPEATHGSTENLRDCVSASAATLDLAKIENDETFINPRQPDHVPFSRLSDLQHQVVSKIRTTITTTANNLSTAQSRLVTPAEKAWFNKHSNEQKRNKGTSWCRVNPNKPMPTIVTTLVSQDSRGGPTLHWFENRTCSLMEFRRFHGIPDSYMLVGTREQQLHQIGNSVAWATSTVLGKAYADA